MSILKKYYAKRAQEYEEAYHRKDDPVRKSELVYIARMLKKELKDCGVLEVACGTGYWTQILSKVAKSIQATDAVKEVLNIAKSKEYNCPISFKIADAYNLPFKKKSFDGALANFWFSHIPKSKIDPFLKNLHNCLKPESKVFMVDDVYVEGVGGIAVTKKGDKNSYKLRTLNDGSKHLILKNYFTPKQLIEIFKKDVPNFSLKNIYYGKRFWCIVYSIV